MNIMDLVKNQLNSDMIGNVAGMLGESPDKTKAGLEAVVPSVLAGIMGSASTKEGASNLFNAMNQQEGNLLASLPSMLSGGQGSMLSQQGGNLLTSLLGGGVTSGLASQIAKFTGLPAGSITSLLGLATPMVMGLLKRQSGSMGISDASGLASMLMGQKQNILGSMPKGLSEALGAVPGMGSILGGAGQSVATAGRAVANTASYAGREPVAATHHAPGGGLGLLKWLIPLIAAAGLLYFLFGRAKPAPVVAPVAPSAVKTAVESVSAKLTGNLTSIFGDATKAFTGIKDVASAEAAIPQIKDMTGKLDGMLSTFNTLTGVDKSEAIKYVTSSLGKLQPLIDAAMKIPGVEEKLGPVVKPLLEKLKAFGA